MEPFVTHTGRALPLRRTNVDTDQIIPAVYLKRVTREGFGDGLFAAWREDPSFVLNQPRYEGATILVAGTDFGTGSSREHAVWALLDYGFRAVIAPRFGDIFRTNSTKAGLLPVVLPEKVVALIQDAAEAEPPAEVTVDLDAARGPRHRRRPRRGPGGAVPDRRLHPLAPHGGPGRHRPDAQPRGRDLRLRGQPPVLPPGNAVIARGTTPVPPDEKLSSGSPGSAPPSTPAAAAAPWGPEYPMSGLQRSRTARWAMTRDRKRPSGGPKYPMSGLRHSSTPALLHCTLAMARGRTPPRPVGGGNVLFVHLADTGRAAGNRARSTAAVARWPAGPVPYQPAGRRLGPPRRDDSCARRGAGRPLAPRPPRTRNFGKYRTCLAKRHVKRPDTPANIRPGYCVGAPDRLISGWSGGRGPGKQPQARPPVGERRSE